MSPPDTNPENGTQRIEAFSDAVFAIAITLLILEIKVPRQNGVEHVTDLAATLCHLWPYYFAYILSFITVGIYWANHHYLFQFFRRTDHVFNLLNILFLMTISFLPFPTAILSEFYSDPRNHPASVTFYCIGLFLPALTWLFFWLYGSRHYRLIDEKLSPPFVARLSRQYWLSLLPYILAFAVSFLNVHLSLAIAVGATALYLLPPKTPEYWDSARP